MYKLICQNTDLMPYSNNVTWSSDTDTLGVQMSFDSLKDLKEGAVVSRWLNGIELFRGVIIKKTKKRWTFSYVCQDYGFYLKNKVIKQFNNVATSDAINSLLGEAYIISDVCQIPTLINKIYKNKTLAEIIDDILDQAEKDQGIKYFKEINANILTVKKLSDMIITPQILLPKELDIDSSIEDMKNRIIITSTDDKDTTIMAMAEDSSQQDFYGVLTDMETIDNKDIAQAQNIAKNMLAAKNKIFNSTSFDFMEVKGAEAIRANRLIFLQAGSRLNGYYKIKCASHTLNKGTHKINIGLEW